MVIDDAEKKQTNQFDAGVILDGKSLGLPAHSEMMVLQSLGYCLIVRQQWQLLAMLHQ